MLLLIATILAVIACALLLVFPQIGVLSIFLVRPVVDTAWQEFIFFGFKLTELVSVAVPLITFIIVMLNFGTQKSVFKMPLFKFWIIYLIYVFIFSFNIAITSSLNDAANVFFRFSNGFVGFYLVQAYFFKEEKKKLFFLALVLAGLFPIATGLYEAITGVHWKITMAQGKIRNIGLYHDAITIRYYALQTILAITACLALKFPRNFVFKLVLVGLFASSLLVAFNTFSKSAIATIFLWIGIWSYGRRSWIIPAIVLGGALFLVPVYFEEISDTVFTVLNREIGFFTGEIEMERTFSGRWFLWEEMIEKWKKFDIFQQLFGAGRITLYAHNDYLQMLFHGGFIGLAFYLWFLIIVGWKLVHAYLKTRDLLSILAFMAYCMWIVDSIGLIPSLYAGYQWFVWGVIGLGLKSQIEVKKAKAHEVGVKKLKQHA